MTNNNETESNYYKTDSLGLTSYLEINGLKYIGLLDEENKVRDLDKDTVDDGDEEDEKEDGDQKDISDSFDESNTKIEKDKNEYVVHIYGPGMNSKMVVKEKEDIDIVNAMLKKVKKRMEIEENNGTYDSQ